MTEDANAASLIIPDIYLTSYILFLTSLAYLCSLLYCHASLNLKKYLPEKKIDI